MSAFVEHFHQSADACCLLARADSAPPDTPADWQVLRDASVVAEARRDALQLFERDPLLADPQLARLRQLIQKRWGETLGLAQIG